MEYSNNTSVYTLSSSHPTSPSSFYHSIPLLVSPPYLIGVKLTPDSSSVLTTGDIILWGRHCIGLPVEPLTGRYDESGILFNLKRDERGEGILQSCIIDGELVELIIPATLTSNPAFNFQVFIQNANK